MSYKTDERVKTIKLAQPYQPETLKVKRDFKTLPAAMGFFAIMLVICIALSYLGDTYRILTFGEDAHGGNLPGFVGVIFFFVGLIRVAKTVDAINEAKTDESNYRRQRYSRDVLMPAIKNAAPGVGSFTDLMADKLMREGYAGMWSRIDGTDDGTVYMFTIKDDILTLTTHIEVHEATDQYVGGVN